MHWTMLPSLRVIRETRGSSLLARQCPRWTLCVGTAWPQSASQFPCPAPRPQVVLRITAPPAEAQLWPPSASRTLYTHWRTATTTPSPPQPAAAARTPASHPSPAHPTSAPPSLCPRWSMMRRTATTSPRAVTATRPGPKMTQSAPGRHTRSGEPTERPEPHSGQ